MSKPKTAPALNPRIHDTVAVRRAFLSGPAAVAARKIVEEMGFLNMYEGDDRSISGTIYQLDGDQASDILKAVKPAPVLSPEQEDALGNAIHNYASNRMVVAYLIGVAVGQRLQDLNGGAR